VLLAVAGAGVAAAIVLLRGDDPITSQDASVTRTAPLLSEPRDSGATLVELAPGTTLELLGRTADSLWLFVAPIGRSDQPGWLPASVVRDPGNVSRLTAIEVVPGVPATVPGGVRAQARSDLVLHSVGSKQDRLFVVIANDGNADFTGSIAVAVNDGPPRRLDPGKPLRPGEALEAVLNTEYVQRRARVLVTVSTPDGVDAAADNNRLEVVVAPDQPIDLELAGAQVDPGDGHLSLSVRNHGPIPLVGSLSISVREPPPSNRLLATNAAALDMGPDALQRIDLPPPANPAALTRVTVSITTDAIADANPENDTYPR
jgi:hypothetical protein